MNIADTRTSSACEQNLLVLICPFLYTLLRPIHVLLVIFDTAGSSRIYSAFLCNFRLLHPSFFGIVSMYNMTHLREEFTFEETISISDNSRCLRWTCVLHCKFTRFSDTLPCNGLPRACLTFCFWFGFERITTTTKPLRSSAGIASMRKPASREIISDSVELCDAQACFLHIQLIGTHVWLRNSHNVPPEVDFESKRSPAKSESWNSPIGIVMLYFPRNNMVCTYSRNECKWSNVLDVCRKLWSTLWSHVQVCWLTIEYQVYQCVANTHISGQFESIHLTILPRISLLLLWIDGHE